MSRGPSKSHLSQERFASASDGLRYNTLCTGPWFGRSTWILQVTHERPRFNSDQRTGCQEGPSRALTGPGSPCVLCTSADCQPLSLYLDALWEVSERSVASGMVSVSGCGFCLAGETARFGENLELSGRLRGHQPGLPPSNRNEPLGAGVFQDMCIIRSFTHLFTHSFIHPGQCHPLLLSSETENHLYRQRGWWSYGRHSTKQNLVWGIPRKVPLKSRNFG